MDTLTQPEPSSPERHDAHLVTATLAGDRDAFAVIVSRYRALVCSVAYSATGSLSQSEDVAQEAFVAAWRSLGQLEEPEKLRSWLCGIARNLASNGRRRATRDPARGAEPLDAAYDAAAHDPLPVEQAIGKQEEAILWRTLERVSETYRTPLILFYREQQSVERVAALLGLGEDVVRQRLTRGRRALAEEVLAFVEGTLARSVPGEDFTRGVLAGLPASGGAALGGAGVALAKTGALAKSAAIGAAFTGVLGVGTGVFSAWSSLRTGLALARTPAERALVVRQVKMFVALGVAFAVMVALFLVPRGFWAAHASALAASAASLSSVYSVAFVALVARAIRAQRRLAAPSNPMREWRSKATFLGLPLWHVRLDVPGAGARPVVAWIAVGDYAVGVLFALGTVSFGGVSVGAVSVGLLDVGTVAFGVVSVGAVSFGGLAVGTVAAGVVAFGALSFAWHAAAGGEAFGLDLAGGDIAFAPHANDAAVVDFFTRIHAGTLCQALLAMTAVLVIVPLTWVRRLARRLRSTE